VRVAVDLRFPLVSALNAEKLHRVATENESLDCLPYAAQLYKYRPVFGCFCTIYNIFRSCYDCDELKHYYAF